MSGVSDISPVDPLKAWAFGLLFGLLFMLVVLAAGGGVVLAAFVGMAATVVAHWFGVRFTPRCSSPESSCRSAPVGTISLSVARRPGIGAAGFMLLAAVSALVSLRSGGPALSVLKGLAMTAVAVPFILVGAARTLPSATGWRNWCEQLRLRHPLLWLLLATPHVPLLPVAALLPNWFEGPMDIDDLLFTTFLLGFCLWYYGVVVPSSSRRLMAETT